MSARDLDAAGIADPALRASYERCRRLHASHGRTYYLATLLLPRAKRPFVHALYGFARYADELVDDLADVRSPRTRAARLAAWSRRALDDLAAGFSRDPVVAATADTARRWGIGTEDFAAFLDSMAMDLEVRQYADYAALARYMHGSAAVIGRQMVPILGPLAPEAYAHAELLGIAFQLANFIRDVGEDLDRGRVYLPMDELVAFDVTRADLERRIATPAIRDAIAFQVGRVRRLSDAAEPGVALLEPTSRPCIDAARRLYCGIVDEVERADYDVFARRATVPLRRRLAVAAGAALRAQAARRAA